MKALLLTQRGACQVTYELSKGIRAALRLNINKHFYFLFLDRLQIVIEVLLFFSHHPEGCPWATLRWPLQSPYQKSSLTLHCLRDEISLSPSDCLLLVSAPHVWGEPREWLAMRSAHCKELRCLGCVAPTTLRQSWARPCGSLALGMVLHYSFPCAITVYTKESFPSPK